MPIVTLLYTIYVIDTVRYSRRLPRTHKIHLKIPIIHLRRVPERARGAAHLRSCEDGRARLHAQQVGAVEPLQRVARVRTVLGHGVHDVAERRADVRGDHAALARALHTHELVERLARAHAVVRDAQR